MKVAVISYFAPQFVIPLTNSLSRWNDILLILPSVTNNNESYKYIDSRIKSKFFNNYRFRNPMNCISMLNIRNEINKFKPDLIHIHNHGHPWFSIIFPSLKKYKILNTVHNITLNSGFDNIYTKIMMKAGIFFSDKYIVHGSKIKETFCKQNKIDKSLTFVVPHGNYSNYNRYNQNYKEKENTVLFFGNLKDYKGLKYLLQAIPLIKKEVSSLTVKIVYHGDDISKYDKYIGDKSSIKIEERFVPDHDLPKYFLESSIVIVPYLEASQSGIVALAYNFGRPVIASSVGSIPEVVRDGETGYLVPPKDSAAIAEKVVKLLNNPSLRSTMGEKAKIYSDTQMSWNNSAIATQIAYKSFASNKDD